MKFTLLLIVLGCAAICWALGQRRRSAFAERLDAVAAREELRLVREWDVEEFGNPIG